ncbi:MAG: 3-phenylpropionate/trans-cinnamate dioxygenase ferredoxin reductase component [Thermoleophilaceae bacterium]|nr:3-phenylpropionate/trans-cinnamate dioxygenase ferredoxin reductase component [Thermoleophilaceae bacterium]
MADRSVDFLIVGGGRAAGSCAKTLREDGVEGSILLVGREPDPPYDRPPLSKEYLAGELEREKAFVQPPEWWEENSVEVLTGASVMKLDPDERVAKLSSREEVSFGKALIATGANVRRLRAEGGDLEGVHYLRAFGNSDAIRAEAAEAERVVLIGGSYIGCEVAATLTAMGRRCAIVMQEEVTLERHFGREVGGFFQGVLEEHGVEVHGGDELERYEGSDGRVERVVTKGGLSLDCRLVVVGAGVIPDTMLAKAAGLELGDAGGVRCSDRLETSVEGIYVAGDIAEYDSPLHGGPARIEHWDVANEHGKTVARNMAGRDVPHEAIPYFWSDLSDWTGLEYVGVGSGAGDPVIRGSLDDGRFTAWSLTEDGRLVAAVTIGRSDDLEHARRMMSERAKPDQAALADESTDLSTL